MHTEHLVEPNELMNTQLIPYSPAARPPDPHEHPDRQVHPVADREGKQSLGLNLVGLVS